MLVTEPYSEQAAVWPNPKGNTKSAPDLTRRQRISAELDSASAIAQTRTICGFA